MALTGNKGEWSEVYALFKLLGDGLVYAGDEDLYKIEDLFYPIVQIIRQESKLYSYTPNKEQDVVVISEDEEEVLRLPMTRFIEAAENLLYNIKTAKNTTFSDAEAETFMQKIKCSALKAKSTDKSDIRIRIHDLRTGMQPVLGFSIKSQLGQASTLLNAGQTTNFTYRCSDYNFSNEEIDEVNAMKSQTDRMSCLANKGCVLEYYDMDNSAFKNNLMLVDSQMPALMGAFVREYYTSSAVSVRDVVERVISLNPLSCNKEIASLFYSHNMKKLLIDVALGMVPATLWTGRYDATGGYLVVRQDGEIVCYHFYNRNEIENYLYNNTRFDRPSRSRYDYGRLYRGHDGGVYMKLNLQIRFK